MRLFVSSLLLAGILNGAAFAAPAAEPTPARVDNLSPDDVNKAISALKENFAGPGSLSDAEIARATLQGLLDRLAPAACLVTSTTPAAAASPFNSELYQDKTGYLRLGQLTQENIEKAKSSLNDWSAKGLAGVVLDLRGTPPSNDFTGVATLAGFFCPKGTVLFSLNSGHTDKPSDSLFHNITASTTTDPLIKGIVVVLVDAGTGEAPEALAACLQKGAKAIVVGDRTAGRAYQFTDVPLTGAILRIAVGRVTLPSGKELGDLAPDITVGIGAPKAQIMQIITSKGIGAVIDEHDRPHLNEAALVSGSNPELDELQAEQSAIKPAAPILDRQLQRALDIVTSISIYQNRAER